MVFLEQTENSSYELLSNLPKGGNMADCIWEYRRSY